MITLRRTVICLTCLSLFTLVTVVVGARQTADEPTAETARGIALYRQGDFDGAIEALKKAGQQNPEDADAWQFLGLAYQQKGDEKGARKALERAVYLRLAQLSPRNLRVVGRGFPAPAAAELAAARAEQARRYQAALETLEAYIRLNPKDADFWRGQAESLQFYSAHLDHNPSDPEAPCPPEAVTTRAVILSKPPPQYTEEARRNHAGGQITLRLVLAADGTVQHILVTRPLPYGLTATAVEAAKRISFQPATKDGRPVAQIMTVMYGYSIF